MQQPYSHSIINHSLKPLISCVNFSQSEFDTIKNTIASIHRTPSKNNVERNNSSYNSRSLAERHAALSDTKTVGEYGLSGPTDPPRRPAPPSVGVSAVSPCQFSGLRAMTIHAAPSIITDRSPA
jgi:hypothetical protein